MIVRHAKMELRAPKSASLSIVAHVPLDGQEQTAIKASVKLLLPGFEFGFCVRFKVIL